MAMAKTKGKRQPVTAAKQAKQKASIVKDDFTFRMKKLPRASSVEQLLYNWIMALDDGTDVNVIAVLEVRRLVRCLS